MSLHWPDLVVIAFYFIGIAYIGWQVSVRQKKTSEQYFIAERSIPGWAVAFSLMGTLIGTGTFVGHPGTVYQKGLILLLPHFLLFGVLLIVAKVVVPFYRRVVRMSAYEYIGKRFGLGGRFYTSFGFLADRTFDLGVTLLTTGFAVYALTGWGLQSVIIGVALFTIIYTMLGGITAVVWTDVAQGIVLIAGGLFVLLRLLFAPEAGAPFAVVGEAWRGGRLTIGSLDFTWASLFDAHTTTLWMFGGAYFIQWMRRYATDQHMVQRYLIAKTDRDASRGAIISAFMCVPIFAMFMFIGACIYGFFQLSGDPGPAMPDNAMPFFLAHYLPSGVLGLLVAAILAAAMSTVSGDLNSVSTVLTTDYFGHFFPNASDGKRLLCGRLMVAVGGAAAALVATLLIPTQGSAPLMERAIMIATILAGGTLGLFGLGFLTTTATRRGCYIGIWCCLLFTTWAILTEPRAQILDLGFNFTMNPIMIGVFGHFILFGTGWLASKLFGGYRPAEIGELTFWSKKMPTVSVK